MKNIKLSNFFTMIIISFFTMYAVMYMMVDKFSNIYINLDQFYMALVMTSLMVLVEVLIMKSMYIKKERIIIMIIAVMVFVISFAFVRNQTAISDKEFLKSMISHHGAAVLMCNKAKIQDAEIQKLCKEIIASQQLQINWMKNKLSTFK